MSSAGPEPPVRVTDPADPRVADYVGLTDVARRHRVEPAAAGGRGLFVAEGELVIRRAAAAGCEVRSLLLAERRYDVLAPRLAGVPGPRLVAGDALLAAVTGFHVHRGALAAFLRPPERAVADVLRTARRVLVLEGLTNTTNVGAVFRSAAALGMDAVLLDPRCGDPLYRRAVRVSMGEVFAVPWARVTPWPDGLGALRDAGYVTVALTPAAAAEPLPVLAADPPARLAVLLGEEGPGLSGAALAAADRRVAIPMAAGVDSLNVAAAAAVACYALGRAAGAYGERRDRSGGGWSGST